MPTAATNVLRDAVRAALQAAAVATAAGIGAAKWALGEDVGGHVFDGDARLLLGRNRGRLPFLEFWLASSDTHQLSYEGGTRDSRLVVRVHVGGRAIAAAEELAREILAAAVSAIRYLPADGYTWLGDDAADAFKPGPFGHQLDVSLTVRHAYGRDESGTAVDVGGTPEAYMFDSTNAGIVAIAAGQPVNVGAGGVVLADASDGTLPAVALATEAVAVGVVGTFQTEGILDLADWSDALESGNAVLVPGTDYFLSLVTGKLTATVPAGSGQLVQLIGTAVSTTELDLRISDGVVLA